MENQKTTPVAEDAPFKVVTYRKGKRSNFSHKQDISHDVPLCSGKNESPDEVDKEAVKNIIRKVQNSIGNEELKPFYEYIKILLGDFLKSLGKDQGDSGLRIKEILCYGLGSFSDSTKARHQFGLLLLLRNHCNVPVALFDPVFSSTEKYLLSKVYNFNLIEIDEEVKRTVEDLTFFFLPHLPNIYIDNLLSVNWCPEKLENCIIFSNSFLSITENERAMSRYSKKYIHNAVTMCVEIPVGHLCRYKDVFNDMAIHVFPRAKLATIPDSIWKQ